jgi:hypothetical protein
VIGLHKCDSKNCNSEIVIGSDYLLRSVCVEMTGDPLFPPAPKTVAPAREQLPTARLLGRSAAAAGSRLVAECGYLTVGAAALAQ